MRFQFNGKTYEITFQRTYQSVRNPYWRGVVVDGEIICYTDEHPEYIRSKYPYTTATINIVVENPDKPGQWNPVEEYRTNTVGCLASEPNGFSPNRGRVRALRGMNPTLPKEMLPILWDAYNGRNRRPAVEKKKAA